MLQFLRTAAAVVAVLFASIPVGRAEAACQFITATHSAATKAEAAQSSRALAVQSAYQLKSTRHWSYVTLSAEG
jgi:hypothetical protein